MICIDMKIAPRTWIIVIFCLIVAYFFGYGIAVINEEQAAAIRQTCENYLSGMSMTQAARAAGINMNHSGVKRLMLNPRYLGDDFYPAILTPEIAQAVEAERQRRDALYK